MFPAFASSSPGENATLPTEAAVAIVNAYAAGIRPSVSIILTDTVFGSILIPLLTMLFYFSTSTSRCQPIFILNVLSIICGIVVAIWSTTLQVLCLACIYYLTFD
jgi:hypothetical protein